MTVTHVVRPQSLHNSPNTEAGVESECLRLYFENLHLVYPVLDEREFISRVKSEVWSVASEPHPPNSYKRNAFLALYNAVLALGAITAGETFRLNRDHAGNGPSNQTSEETTHHQDIGLPSLKVAKAFFERTKLYLGDVFEVNSMESTQALLLLVSGFLPPGLLDFL